VYSLATIETLLSELVDLQRQDVALQRQILAALEQQRRPVTTLSRSDRAVLFRMLPAVVGG
jgi:hypothetical protein